MNNILVVVLCQQPLFRAGIEHSLSKINDIEFLPSGDFHKEVRLSLDTLLPDVIIADIDDSSGESFKIIREIKQHMPNIGVILVSNNDDDDHIFEALKSHASAYLTRGVTTEELVNIVRRVASGEYPINDTFVNRPKVASQVVKQFQNLTIDNDAKDSMLTLTPREIEIIEYIAQGYSNKQIAIELGVSEQTIKTHVASILHKLNANTRTVAVVLAIKQGLISVS